MKKFTVSALSLLVVLITGFAAYASKPDFAYPKQVSKTARKELKNALRIGNGPAVVRSVINLSLADLAADPDSVNMVEQDIAMTASKVKDPATWAMLQLLRADVTDSVRWADSALVYTDALRRASVKEWREVIVADSVYIPTLYDFAVSMRLDMQPSDSLLSQVLEFHKGEPAPYMTAQELYFDFLPAEGSLYLDRGVWTFTLWPLRIVTGNYTFYLPSETVRSADTRFVRTTPDVTLTIPSTAMKVVTVGAYDPVYESYADFSGRGYLYQDQVNSRTSDTFVKPDLVAPGVGVLAPNRDGGYSPVTGTSFAAPFATGAAALLMQWGIVMKNDPYLYGEKVKAYLRKGAKPIRGVAEYPDSRVGYGALCLASSLTS